MNRTVIVLAGALGLLLSLGGCSGDALAPEPVDLVCPVEAGGPVTLIIGARANSPVPTLPEEVTGLIREAAKRSRKVQVVRLDGAPAVTFSGTFRTDARNDVAIAADLDTFLQTTRAQIVGLKPKEKEADVLEALDEAAQITPAGGTVVLIDSGLQTTSELAFQSAGMFDADPTEVVAFLADQSLLPDLSGRAVVLVGLGNTAEPQAELEQPQRLQVINLWKAIVEKSKPSCVEALNVAEHRKSITTDIPVTPVPLPKKPEFKPCGVTVLSDGGSVGFLPNQAVFRSPEAARATLTDLANQIKAGRLKVKLEGSTATAGNSEEDRKRLAKARAEAVKTVLVELGVDGGSVETVGLGTSGTDRVQDLDAHGKLIPDKAAQNRKVVVKLSCPG